MKAAANFTRDENLRESQALADLFFTVYNSPKPVVARVHGAALGGGAGLVAACDIAIAALGTQFGFTEVAHPERWMHRWEPDLYVKRESGR